MHNHPNAQRRYSFPLPSRVIALHSTAHRVDAVMFLRSPADGAFNLNYDSDEIRNADVCSRIRYRTRQDSQQWSLISITFTSPTSDWLSSHEHKPFHFPICPYLAGSYLQEIKTQIWFKSNKHFIIKKLKRMLNELRFELNEWWMKGDAGVCCVAHHRRVNDGSVENKNEIDV